MLASRIKPAFLGPADDCEHDRARREVGLKRVCKRLVYEPLAGDHVTGSRNAREDNAIVDLRSSLDPPRDVD